MAAWSQAGWELVSAYTMAEDDPRHGSITAFHFFWRANGAPAMSNEGRATA